MKPREHERGEDEADAEVHAEPERPAVAYRVSGDLEVRAKELEQEIVYAKTQMREMEREVYAARKIVRRRKALSATATGGVGSALGSLAALLLYAFGVVNEPGFLLGMVLVAFVLGALVGFRWDRSDDDFPKAPPPRLYF